MFHVHSKLSKKILKKFLTIYTIIFVFLFLIVFAGGGAFFLYNAKKNIESKITTITNIWDEFETTKREQIYSLLSTDKFTRYLQEYYRNTSVQTYERVNLCLANFQTSDSVINYLFMEDEEGNLFHSLNSSDSEIEDVLRNSTEYQKIKETGSSSISPIKKGETAAFPSF